jgi:hypothetical protein
MRDFMDEKDKVVEEGKAVQPDTPKKFNLEDFVVPIKDPDWERMIPAFMNGNYIHSDNQIILRVDDDHIAIGLLDPFAQKFWRPVRFVAVFTEDSALAMAKEIIKKIQEREEGKKNSKK